MKFDLLSCAATASFLLRSAHSSSTSSSSSSSSRHLLRGGDRAASDVAREGVVPRRVLPPAASPFISSIVSNYNPDVVTEWNAVMLSAIRAASTPPPKASRIMAMVNLAMFEALNGIYGRYDRYHVTGSPSSGASGIAAASTAAHGVLVSIFASNAVQVSIFDSKLSSSLALIPSGVSLQAGIEWGTICGNDVLALRANDGSENIVGYASPGSDPGYWESTPPAYAMALLPNWPNVLPFAMSTSMELRPPGPPSLTSAEYAIAYDEVKNYGNRTSTMRTSEMSQIALFWADGAGTETPPGHWLRIASDLCVSRGVPTLDRSRLLALLGLGVADAAILSWDAKYYYHHWRPITAIRSGSIDGNPSTIDETTFLPYIGTPPFPAYTSGHSTFSGTSSRILGRIFGDGTPFATTSNGLANVTRSYPSLSSAAAEAGQSRIYGGIHFQYDNQVGLSSGIALGDLVVDGYLRLRGDLNNDGCVDDADLAILRSQIGSTGPSRADLNGDGIVNGRDRAAFVKAFAPFKC